MDQGAAAGAVCLVVRAAGVVGEGGGGRDGA